MLKLLFSGLRLLNSRNMSRFIQVSNPLTGRSEWEPRCEDYDYHQEVARSAFADMLHDTERNQKYYASLRKTIAKYHEAGRKAHVLDIGTGTGILSMMAVKCGADSVVACEAFQPMANCAVKIIEANGMADRITLIRKRSTEIKVGDSGDLKERANILVTEVFDTELIGEGAISIFNHAHKYLLTEDCAVIPHSSSVYIQVVESPLAASWNKPKLIANLDGDVLLKTPKDIVDCEGEAAVHDIQLSQFPTTSFCTIVEPTKIFDFDWSGKSGSIPCDRTKSIELTSKVSSTLQVVFFWWDLKMDSEGEIILSCAPYWAHPDFKENSKTQNSKPIQNQVPWRDHWMQGVYFLPKELSVSQNETFHVTANHDEYSFWFHAQKKDSVQPMQRLRCTCGVHLAYSRTRIGQLNNSVRNKKYLRILEDKINPNSNVLVLSDGSLIGLATSALGANSVYLLETHTLSRNVMEMYIDRNNLKNVKIIKSIEELNDLKSITHVVSEPSFVTSIVPWDNLYFGTLLMRLKDKLPENVEILPHSAKIYAMPVEFLDLQKIRSPLGICEGFDLSIFDNFVEVSADLADAIVEAQPLWEYPCVALAVPKEVLHVNLRNFEDSQNRSGSIEIEHPGSCNGVALWVDWNLDGSNHPKAIVSTGCSNSVEVGKYVTWDMYTRQGVHIFPHAKNLKVKDCVEWHVLFEPSKGVLNFKFSYKQS